MHYEVKRTILTGGGARIVPGVKLGFEEVEKWPRKRMLVESGHLELIFSDRDIENSREESIDLGGGLSAKGEGETQLSPEPLEEPQPESLEDKPKRKRGRPKKDG